MLINLVTNLLARTACLDTFSSFNFYRIYQLSLLNSLFKSSFNCSSSLNKLFFSFSFTKRHYFYLVKSYSCIKPRSSSFKLTPRSGLISKYPEDLTMLVVFSLNYIFIYDYFRISLNSLHLSFRQFKMYCLSYSFSEAFLFKIVCHLCSMNSTCSFSGLASSLLKGSSLNRMSWRSN